MTHSEAFSVRSAPSLPCTAQRVRSTAAIKRLFRLTMPSGFPPPTFCMENVRSANQMPDERAITFPRNVTSPEREHMETTTPTISTPSGIRRFLETASPFSQAIR